MYFYTLLSSYIYCPLLRWVNMQEWWVNITGIYTINRLCIFIARQGVFSQTDVSGNCVGSYWFFENQILLAEIILNFFFYLIPNLNQVYYLSFPKIKYYEPDHPLYFFKPIIPRCL